MCIQVPRQNCTKSTTRGGDVFQQAQSCLGPFPDAIICGPSCKSLAKRDLLGCPPKRLPLSETGSPAYMRTCLAQSSDLELKKKSQHGLPRQSDSGDDPSVSQRYGHKELTPLPLSHSQGQICTPHPLTIPTEHACHHSSFWGSRCDSNHAPTISLKLVHFHGDFGIPFRHMIQVLSRHT